ncbi:wsv364 [White spot syndrome virus]|uniref:Wsv364 n=4 Tax=White spot syndrome virus TaxID=342409 RepID=Q8VAN7_WSSVS|nr:wsv364 [Shrimp white spot syndrome virus]AFX59741.1 wsv364 [White spot syndrome virus]AAL33366.1 wsv364 [Shrimp white spot syndrome virus]AAL89291.1 WSSV423 [Shrimp white spot syndrome virus]AWQ60490.1 wsv364 [Shrimp white spot syndrome virus]AWQ60935.1 wsv364 [Shrimp white spot syndrome virus]
MRSMPMSCITGDSCSTIPIIFLLEERTSSSLLMTLQTAATSYRDLVASTTFLLKSNTAERGALRASSETE